MNPPDSSRACTHSEIERLIPHQGSMCLLARADSWDDVSIVCSASNHRDPDHPLRTRGALLSACLIEYAAQACAVHGALLARAGGCAASARPGVLAAARNVQLTRTTLDTLPRTAPDELRIEARREAGDGRQLLYAFTASHCGEALASGRITVLLDTADSNS